MLDISTVLARIDNQLPDALDRLFELLRIESISTDPAYKEECRKAGSWLVDQLNEIGFEASLRDTEGHPMVVGHHDGPKGAPHLLFTDITMFNPLIRLSYGTSRRLSRL